MTCQNPPQPLNVHPPEATAEAAEGNTTVQPPACAQPQFVNLNKGTTSNDP